MPLAAPIITVDEAMDFLNITDVAHAEELSQFIDAASEAWVRRVGPVEGSPVYTETYDGGSSQIVLRHAPVQSILSVSEAYTTSMSYTLTEQVLGTSTGGDSYGYSVDRESGVLNRRAMGSLASFARGVRNVTVSYVAGYAVVPADIRHAVQLLVKHMWETQRGGSRRPGSSADTQEFAPGGSHTWPQRVEEIAAGYYIPGIA